MKKSFLILATAALVLTGCSNNDVKENVENEQVLIGFADSYIGKPTKANTGEFTTTTLATTGNTMAVWGYKTYNSDETTVFDKQEVTYDSSNTGTTKWSYSPLKYWDKAATYNFYAVAPNSSKWSMAEGKKIKLTGAAGVLALTELNGTGKITSANTTAVDYLVAGKESCAGKDKGNASDDDVEFTFSHIMSKLAVKVKTTDAFNNDGSTYPQIKIEYVKIKLQGMCPNYTQAATGVVSAADDTWDGSAMSETEYTCFNADGSTVTEQLLNTTASEIATYLVAPTATKGPATFTGDDAYKVSVKYKIYYSASETETFESKDNAISTLTRFAQNTSNTLTITVGPAAIYFDVNTVGDWSNGADGTVSVE